MDKDFTSRCIIGFKCVDTNWLQVLQPITPWSAPHHLWSRPAKANVPPVCLQLTAPSPQFNQFPWFCLPNPDLAVSSVKTNPCCRTVKVTPWIRWLGVFDGFPLAIILTHLSILKLPFMSNILESRISAAGIFFFFFSLNVHRQNSDVINLTLHGRALWWSHPHQVIQ